MFIGKKKGPDWDAHVRCVADYRSKPDMLFWLIDVFDQLSVSIY